MKPAARLAVPGTASIAMYPFVEVRDAFEHLWRLVRERLTWTPALLDWPDVPADTWRSPDLVVGQTCAWPLMTALTDTVRVVGSFEHTVPDAVGPTYRSVLIARAVDASAAAGGLEALADRTAAVNDTDSLSGWVSLLHTVHGPGARWHGPVRLTGAHVESVRAVREGRADVASIDAVTWWLVSRLRPAAVEGLAQIGQGPRVPCLPVIVGHGVPDDAIAELRWALDDAVRDDRFRTDRARIAVRGFVGLDLDQYRPVLELAPAPDAAATLHAAPDA
ncbi:MAG: PhnD/SsuA/transferrin family substrate-binding protein [Acidimicrobiales bacterium]